MAENEQVEVVTQAIAEVMTAPDRRGAVIGSLQFTRMLLARLAEHGWVVVPLPSLDDQYGARATDPDTSHAGAEDVVHRRGSYWHRLLVEYARGDGTDEEIASELALLKACYWKRCSELRQAGMIVDTGERRDGVAGVPRMVCRITALGMRELRRLNE